MESNEIKDLIVSIVNDAQGIKAVELVVKVTQTVEIPAGVDLSVLIKQLIDGHRLVEVEYVLPTMSYRVKSFLLPAMTRILGKDTHGN